MSVSLLGFVAVVAGLVLAVGLSTPSGILSIRLGLARGRKAVGAMLLPVLGTAAVVGLLWLNPVDGEYRASVWLILLSVVGPVAAIFDLRKVLAHRRNALPR
jgi:RsiW-degrading membrane proteinase PrsW (M82 family)